MPDATVRAQPHEADDGFDVLPTRVAFTPEEAPTTLVDLSHVDPSAPAAPPAAPEPAPLSPDPPLAEGAAYPPDEPPYEPYPHAEPAPQASYPHEPAYQPAYPSEEPPYPASYPHEPAYEPPYPHEAPYAAAAPFPAHEPASERGWGPQVPDDLKKTTFFERDRFEAGRSQPAPDAAPSPSPLRAQHTALTRRKAPSSRALIVGAVCVAAGVALGTALGIAASRGDDDDGEAPAAATASARVPEPAPAEPAPVAPAPVVPAPAEPVAQAPVAPTPAEVAAPVPEPAPAPEPASTATYVPTASEALEAARLALRDGDAAATDAALARARAAGADPLALARIEAELAVMRGDGALAVPRLRDLAEIHRDAAIYAALGRVLVQAEQDRAASEAFGTALQLDPRNVEGHLGMAEVHARAAALGPARRHHREAEEAARGIDDAMLEARVRATGALILLESGQVGAALREAEVAQRLDGLSSEAALLQARIARVRNQPAEPFLRQALNGRAPAPMAIALLAESLHGDEACELAQRYLERAPQGYDAPAMRRLARRCR
ncbi:MAG TPA: hypothetical protein VIL20_04845 [Sandaracinaceae bacterium]